MSNGSRNTPEGTIASGLLYRFKQVQIMVWWKENLYDNCLHDGMLKHVDKGIARECERFYIISTKSPDQHSEYTYIFQPKTKTRLKQFQVQLLHKGFSKSRQEGEYLFKQNIRLNGKEILFQVKFIKL